MSFIKHHLERRQLHKDPSGYWKKRGAKIGEGSSINPYANLGSEPYLITVGNNVRINHGVEIYTHDGGLWVVRNINKDYKNADVFGKVVIGSNVHIGTNAVVMPNVTIGNNCIVGVGAVVTKDIPDNSVAGGVPARVIETVDEYIEKNCHKYVNTKHMDAEEKRKYILEKLFLN